MRPRPFGTIIGVDKKNELTVLGNVECFGTENRVENVTTSNMTATVVPIMQFANSDIQVLNVVHEHPAVKSLGNTPVKSSSSSHKKESLIHDDPAAISMLLVILWRFWFMFRIASL
ncbi:unnamed protein product [Rotaria magnacalcarata]